MYVEACKRTTPWIFFLGLLSLVEKTNAQPTCSSTSFSVSTPDILCDGLSPQPGITTEQECVDACCSQGADFCGVWQFCSPSDPCFSGTSCWTGPRYSTETCSVKTGSGWKGGMRQPLTCDANSFGKKTNGIRCYGLTAFPLAKTSDECISACCNEGPEDCSTWQFCPDGAACQPQGLSSCWLGQPTQVNCQEQDGAGWIGGIRGTPPEKGSYFSIVPVNPSTGLPLSPPSAIRHCNSVVSVDPFNGNPDFQFKVLGPLSDLTDPAAISLQPYNYFFDFIGAVTDDPFGVMHIANTDTQGVMPLDLSWIVTPGLDNAAFYSLLSTSNNRTGQYLTMSSNPTVPCTYNNPVGDVTTALPGSTVAANGTVISQTFMFVKLTLTQNIVWTREHHDAQNSGYSAWDGPAESSSICLEQMIKDDPLSPNTARFLSSGITSAVDSWWFGGSTDDTLYMLEDLLVSQQNDETWQSWTLNLTKVLGVSSPAAPYGIVGSPAYLYPSDYNTPSYDATKNMLFVSSSNGWVAGLNPLYCFTGGKKPLRSSSSAMSLLQRAASRKLRGRSNLPLNIHLDLDAAPVSDAPNGAQWMIFKDVNALYGCPSGCHVNGSYATWPECQASCWEDFKAKGGLGEPDGCVSWVWHNIDTPDWGLKCLHGMSDGLIEMRSEGGHVSGMLSVKEPGQQCVVWKRQISASFPVQPSYSSVQLVRYRNNDIVLVSETNSDLDVNGILHAYSAINGTHLWYYSTIDNKGLKGLMPAQMTVARDPDGRYVVLAHGSKVVILDLDACSISGISSSCIPLNVFEGAADDFVSSVSISTQFGDRLFVQSSTGALWKISIIWNNAVPSFSPTATWRCVFSRSDVSKCTQQDNVMSSSGANLKASDFGGVVGGFYQPTTATERDELHSEIRALHVKRFGPAGGGLDAIGDVKHVVRLASQLPRSELLSIRTPSGYYRINSHGKPAPTEKIEDFNSPFPLSTPALYEDFVRSNTLVAFIDSPIDGSNSGLFVVDDTLGNPLIVPGTTSTPFAIFNTTLQDGTFAQLGKSRSSPAWDRQRNIYFGSDMDLGGSTTFPALICVDEIATVKWAIGLGEEEDSSSQVGSASVVVTQGPRGDNRAYMVSSDGVSTIVESPLGITCPTAKNLYTCSGHGDCDCATGQCKCDGCWTGADCSISDSTKCVQNGGSCNDDGTCRCGDACHTGTTCEVLLNCGPLGICNPLDASCSCSGCVETNTWGVCNVYNSTSAFCSGQSCNRDGSCSCSIKTCKGGPTCANQLDCKNGGICNTGTGCSCAATCFSVGSDGLCSTPIDCGVGGVCSTGGVCSCLPCWSLGSDNKCSVQETCNSHGSCNSDDGSCTCNPGYGSNSGCAKCDDCFSGSTCNSRTGDATRCNGNGVCVTNEDGKFNTCQCQNGYSGGDCSIAPPSNAVNGSSATSAGSIAAGVLVPLLICLIGGFAYTRRASLQSVIEWGEKSILGTGKKYSPIKVSTVRIDAGSSTASGTSPIRNLSLLGSGKSTSLEVSERASIINAARGKGVGKKQATYG